MKDKIFLALLETQSAHWNLARQGFAQLELTEAQPKILYILLRMEGCVQKELAEAAQIRPSSLTVLLEKMEKQGLIQREETKVSGGKRAYQVYFTKKGRKKAEEVVELVEELEERSFQGFRKDERKLLLQMLGRVAGNLI